MLEGKLAFGMACKGAQVLKMFGTPKTLRQEILGREIHSLFTQLKSSTLRCASGCFRDLRFRRRREGAALTTVGSRSVPLLRERRAAQHLALWTAVWS